jgi:hypothetical protein
MISDIVKCVGSTSRRRGRPPEGRPVAVRLEPELIAALERRARARGTTRAKVLRDLVAKSVDPGDGVDRAQIHRQLRLTPAERVARMAETANTLRAMRARSVEV